MPEEICFRLKLIFKLTATEKVCLSRAWKSIQALISDQYKLELFLLFFPCYIIYVCVFALSLDIVLINNY